MSCSEVFMEKEMLVKRLEEKALEIRKDVITTCYRSAAAHLGGALSLCDVAVEARFVQPSDPVHVLAAAACILHISDDHIYV